MEARTILSIGFRKGIETEHYPITVVEALDHILSPAGYKRLANKPESEEFVWKNDQNERFAIEYYTHVNGLTHSSEFSTDEHSINPKNIARLYTTLKTTLKTLSEQIGSPYMKTTRELILTIQGQNLKVKTDTVIPVVRELYLKEENLSMASVDTLEETEDSIQVLFCPNPSLQD